MAINGLFWVNNYFMYCGGHPWDYMGIIGILGSLFGLQLVIPFIVFVIFFAFGVVVCFKAMDEK